MNYYNIFIEDINEKRSYILAINESQLNRLITAFLNGEPYVNLKGSSRKLNEIKDLRIYSITGHEFEGKTQEQVEEKLLIEKKFFNNGLASLGFYIKYGTNVTDNFTEGMGFGELKGKAKLKVKKIPSEKKGKIFISHATKNHEVVAKFCDLILQNALQINTTKEVFNTSLEGSKPKTGQDFRECIKEELINAKLVLQFISKEYKESEVCLNEMGAAWVLSDNVFPLMIEEDEYEIGFIHKTNQQIQLHNTNHIFKLIDDLKTKGIVEDFNLERLNQKIHEFVFWLKTHKKPKEIRKPVSKVAVKISDAINVNRNPFYNVNKQSSTYYFNNEKYCLIPDTNTLYFLGYANFKSKNHVEIQKEHFPDFFGTPIVSVSKGEIWANSNNNTLWLIYDKQRHKIDDLTYSLLKKENPDILEKWVTTDILIPIIEGDTFSLKID